MSEENNLALLDKDQLKEATENDVGLLNELWEVYNSSTLESIKLLEDQVAASDFLAATKTAHDIKGSSSNMGFLRMHKVAEKTELHCKAKNKALATQESVKLRPFFKDAEEAFKVHLKSLS
jgi:HPt (histidine-containing phosphotransfer) domain-containing protein